MQRKSLGNLWVAILLGVVFAVTIFIVRPADAQEEVQRKPRILIILDTSGSMNDNTTNGDSTQGDGSNDPWPGTDTNCCKGLGGSRMYIAKEAIRKMVATTGEIEFALMTFPQRYFSGGGGYSSRYYGNQISGAYDDIRWGVGPGTSALYPQWGEAGCSFTDCDGAGEPNCHYKRVLFGGANENSNDPSEIAMWVDHHEYSTEPGSYGTPDSNSLAAWLDGTEQEIRAEGATPISNAFLAADTYLTGVQAADNTYVQGCRPYSVVLIADGAETCTGDPSTSAAVLAGHGFDVWAIGLVGGDADELGEVAEAGNTGSAFFANNEEELQDALFQIVSATIQIEVCNDVANDFGTTGLPPWDEDCDCPGNGSGLGDTNGDDLECGPGDVGVNEGYTKYCDVHDIFKGVYNTTDYGFEDALTITQSDLRYCTPPPESKCDNQDDNCDGLVDVPPDTGWPDESFVGDACYADGEPPTAQPDTGCEWYPDGTCLGVCDYGVFVCETGESEPLQCAGDIHPSGPEICDGVDEDCDGVIDDDDVGGGAYSIVGNSPCGICGDGEEQCIDNQDGTASMQCCALGSTSTNCISVQVPADEETCNGIDDNCNTSIDEGNPNGGGNCFPNGEYPNTGCDEYGALCDGLCKPGVAVCDDDCTPNSDNCVTIDFMNFVCQSPTLPAPEICDGLDNDCDGNIDDDGVDEMNPEIDDVCPTADHPTDGECVAGTWQCLSGSMTCDPDGTATEIVYPTAEICDNKDNDCDGETDEDLFDVCGGAPTGDPNEGLCQQGQETCQGGQWGWDEGFGFVAGACGNEIEPSPEVCNGLDDDCNGTDDDGLTNEGPCGGSDPFGCPDSPLGGGECVDGYSQGLCVAGFLFCNTSGQLECNYDPPEQGPVLEECDNDDNDCDGVVDENLNEACYTGSTGCPNFPDCDGICQVGQHICFEGDWGTGDDPPTDWDTNGCDGEILPGDEYCNAMDDDCDGVTDDGVDDDAAVLADDWYGGDCGIGICVGTYVCGPGGSQDCNNTILPGDVEEICDNLDNDCDGFTDEGLYQPCYTEPVYPDGVGICHWGVQACDYVSGDPDSSLNWTECLGEVTPADQEACNGLDDDCDTQTDETPLAEPWNTVCNVCDDLWTCEDGQLVCEDADLTDEICDGEDNDCNGLIDDLTQSCGGCDVDLYDSGDPSTDLYQYCTEPNLGLCQQGTQQCEWNFGSPDDPLNWSGCAGDIGPSTEICDGYDNDCDCPADEDSNLDSVFCNHGDANVDEEGEIWPGGLIGCQNAIGVCEAAVLRCVVDESDNVEIACCAGVVDNPGEADDGECIPPIGPSTEICDGIDNDCDTLTDEDLNVPCGGCDPVMYPGFDCPNGANEGLCQEGVKQCLYVSGLPDDPQNWTDCIGDNGPVLEACNLLDDDCDGETDEGVVYNPPDCGLTPTDNFDEGECEPGIWVCNEDGNDECINAVGPTIEECDGLDNDCDSFTDEELPEVGQICGSDVGICEFGLTECIESGNDADGWTIECVGETTGVKEACNALDDDCDGQTDEDLGFGKTCTNSPTGYPEGECGEGVYECIDGNWECNANEPELEICDGLDNDCDGETDEDLDVDCPESSTCIQGECADECTPEEMSCPFGETCTEVEFPEDSGLYIWVCLSSVCDPDSEDALECLDNPYWCSEGWDPYCVCDSAQGACINICDTITCNDGQVCIPSDGSCQWLGDDCWTQGCALGTICVAGECIDDPCYEVVCEDYTYCSNVTGECVDACMVTDCPEDQGCWEGECVDDECVGTYCEWGWECDPATGECYDCGLECMFYEVCIDGECVEDPCWNLECPNGFVCIEGACYEWEGGGTSDSDTDTDSDGDSDTDSDGDTDSDTDPSDTSTDSTEGPSQALNDVLATGIGGCLCTTTPGAGGNHSPLGVAVMLLGMLMVAIRLGARRLKGSVVGLSIVILVVLLAGCQTNPYDFGGSSTDTDTATDADADSDTDADADNDADTDSDTDECPTDAEEICNYEDDDCDGETDEGFDMQTNIEHCGECDNACEYPHAYGLCIKGVCSMGDCETNFYDLNEDDEDGCEYYCEATTEATDHCDGVDLGDGSYVPIDNDCDGEFDEDVDFLNDPNNCNLCMNVCQYLNAGAICVDGVCAMGDCEENYYDIDGEDNNGCEYNCTPDGPEVCDGMDNDCDFEFDENDSGTGDEYGAEGGGECYTATEGCPDFPNDCLGICEAGQWYCESAELRCKNEVNPSSETCNDLDDDCDDAVDEEEDLPLLGLDGALCGISTGECEQGRMRCAKPTLSDDNEELCCASVDVATNVCTPPEVPVENEGTDISHCDGSDNDCDGFLDEDSTNSNLPMTAPGVCYFGQAWGQDPGEVLGQCAINTGTWTCNWGTFLCVDAIGSMPESCNNLDDDCDGETDEDLYQDCPDPGFEEVGICKWGQQKCQGGQWGWGDGAAFVPTECGNQIPPAEEQCNTLDDDCDNEVDEEEDLLLYEDLIGEVCGEGQCEGLWECDEGQIACSGGDPITEAPCDNVDNDCNGVTDELVAYNCGGCDMNYGSLIGDDTDNYANCDTDTGIDGPNQGQCQTGTWVCEEDDTDSDTLEQQTCLGTILPTQEVCNGEDDDCDGDVDNDPIDVGGACSEGICDGTLICDDPPAIVCEWDTSQEQEEDCNNLDDDCDGFTDEGLIEVCGGCDPDDAAYNWYCTDEAHRDRGECVSGTNTCDGAGNWLGCVGTVPPSPETCDGKDNDCDGFIDNAVTGQASPVITGASGCGPPCNDGTMECVNGVMQCEGETTPGPEECDGLDNDCNANTPDGSGDLDFVYFEPCDGDDSDMCNEGVLACLNGGPDPTCTDPGGNNIEICDGIDNDCDGLTDAEDTELASVGDTSFLVEPAWVCNQDCPGDKVGVCSGGTWQCDYDCTQVECDDGDPGPHAAEESECDGHDGDCDTVVDDFFDVLNNVEHCGDCNQECGTDTVEYGDFTLDNTESYYCENGNCMALTCATVAPDGYLAVDLDNDPSNGCECVPTDTEEIPCNDDDENCDGIVFNPTGMTEVCDGIDNDCDGSTDEVEDIDVPTWVCNNNCSGTVTPNCVNEGGGVYGWTCTYNEVAPDWITVDDVTGQPTTGPEELCDGLDNDCDGIIDDGYPGLGESCEDTYNAYCSETGQGGCNPIDPDGAVLCCSEIGTDNLCDTEINVTPTSESTVPDNKDNDCDGITDEGTACTDSVYLTVNVPGTGDFQMFAYEASMYNAIASTDDAGNAPNSVPCSRDDTMPWTMVNYDDARNACLRLNSGFDDETCQGAGCWDLCTEQQWQFACSAGTAPTTADINPLFYPYGDYYEPETCNGLDQGSVEEVSQTGGSSNMCLAEYGTYDLFDMSGNVEEWTRTPRLVGTDQTLHVIRGGSFNDVEDGLTCTFDMSAGGDADGVEFRMSNLGFRCCRSREAGTCGPAIETWNDVDWDVDEVSCSSGEWCPGNECEPCTVDHACGDSCEQCAPYFSCVGTGTNPSDYSCDLCDDTTRCEANCIDCGNVDGVGCRTHGTASDPQVWTECYECNTNTDCTAPGLGFCSPDNNCVECLVDGDCGGSEVCDGYVCLSSHEECSGTLSLPVGPAATVDATHIITMPELSEDIVDVNVSVDLEHTYIGDLIIDVEHDGTTVLLFNQHCGGDDDMDAIFDQDATTPANDCSGATMSGTFYPWEDSLNHIIPGTNEQGDWTITVDDNAGGDGGTLLEWCVTVYYQ